MSELSEAARDLLPRSADEFGTVDYWDAFYRKRGDAVFHWYVDGARGALTQGKKQREADFFSAMAAFAPIEGHLRSLCSEGGQPRSTQPP